MPEEIKINGVRFDNVNLNETVDFLLNKLKNNKKGYICTPNPEMILEAQKNSDFKKVINNSLLNIPDGIGILWAASNIKNKNSKLKALLTLPLIPFFPGKFKDTLKERVTGVDLLEAVCKKMHKTDYRIFFLGARKGVAEMTAEKLETKYPGIQIVGTYAGSPKKKDRKTIIELINSRKPDILFVAYGAPKQEMWISENLKRLNTVKIAIGIGGAFDFISRTIRRAPKWMQKLGIEWLFRLIQEPSRFKRIYNATIRFPYEVIKKL